MTDFLSLGLPKQLEAALKKMQFNNPTPIQQQAIPPALEGRDILGSAQTGTGKTAAFAIPLVAYLLNNQEGIALVLTPTRELALQVKNAFEQLINNNNSIKTALLIGGDPIGKQFQQLRNRPRVIIGTPGRVNDHLLRGSLKLNQAKFLVLDETDRMLDLGFDEQLERIAKYLPEKRQTLLFSATMPANIMKLAANYLSDPLRISVDPVQQAAPKIKQELIHTTEGDKYKELTKQLDEREGSILVFVKTKIGAEKLAKKLNVENHSADAIHGDLRQHKREKVLNAFRKQKYRIMVATDVVARGLDIPHIEHVINYDLPQCPEDYIHRIGRTARAGREGNALCLITNQDKGKWKAIHRLMNPGEKVNDNDEKRSSPRGFKSRKNFNNSSANGNKKKSFSFDFNKKKKPQRKSYKAA